MRLSFFRKIGKISCQRIYIRAAEIFRIYRKHHFTKSIDKTIVDTIIPSKNIRTNRRTRIQWMITLFQPNPHCINI